jgi:hypothetical protein
MATKAQRHKAKLFGKIYLCVLVSGGENILPQNVVDPPGGQK